GSQQEADTRRKKRAAHDVPRRRVRRIRPRFLDPFAMRDMDGFGLAHLGERELAVQAMAVLLPARGEWARIGSSEADVLRRGRRGFASAGARQRVAAPTRPEARDERDDGGP